MKIKFILFVLSIIGAISTENLHAQINAENMKEICLVASPGQIVVSKATVNGVGLYKGNNGEIFELNSKKGRLEEGRLISKNSELSSFDISVHSKWNRNYDKNHLEYGIIYTNVCMVKDERTIRLFYNRTVEALLKPVSIGSLKMTFTSPIKKIGIPLNGDMSILLSNGEVYGWNYISEISMGKSLEGVTRKKYPVSGAVDLSTADIASFTPNRFLIGKYPPKTSLVDLSPVMIKTSSNDWLVLKGGRAQDLGDFRPFYFPYADDRNITPKIVYTTYSIGLQTLSPYVVCFLSEGEGQSACRDMLGRFVMMLPAETNDRSRTPGVENVLVEAGRATRFTRLGFKESLNVDVSKYTLDIPSDKISCLFGKGVCFITKIKEDGSTLVFSQFHFGEKDIMRDYDIASSRPMERSFPGESIKQVYVHPSLIQFKKDHPYRYVFIVLTDRTLYISDENDDQELRFREI